jgi:DtxR family transcriptional regulator, Mn-dependent transcriptional regulator
LNRLVRRPLLVPTATLEEYLEAIYKISQHGPVRPTQVAESVGVSGPTVTATLRRLEAQGLVVRDGTKVVLTEEGLERSLDIVRRHRIAETFLVDTLKLDWNAAHEEACILEHALSPRVLSALESFLDNPVVCPHGHPIPAADGSFVDVVGVPLCDVGTGVPATVLSVAEDDEKILSYLGDLGLRPGARTKILDAAPFQGPLTVEIEGMRTAIAREIAQLVTVEPAVETA